MPRTIRIAHLADTHLGFRQYHTTCPETGRNQRAVDIEDAFRRTIDDILTQDVELVVHAGDMFHHTRPSWAAIRAFVVQTRRLVEAGLPVVVIAGNHDMPRLRTSDSLFTVLQLALSGVHIVAGYDLEEIPFRDLDLLIHAFPHGALTNPNAATPLLDARTRNLLLTHGLVPGVELKGKRREPGEAEIGASLTNPDLDYIALGHFHIHGPQGLRTYYSGSTERISWTDFEATPGYDIVTLGDDALPVHREIDARPMRRMEKLDADGKNAREIADAILGRAQQQGQPDAMMRITLDTIERATKREVEAIIRKEHVGIAWSLEVQSLKDLAFSPGAFAAIDLPDFSPISLFAQFIEEKQQDGSYTGDFSERFKERGTQALQDALLAAEATATTEELPS